MARHRHPGLTEASWVDLRGGQLSRLNGELASQSSGRMRRESCGRLFPSTSKPGPRK